MIKWNKYPDRSPLELEGYKYFQYLIRYSFEDDLSCCFYGIANFDGSQFYILEDCNNCFSCSCTLDELKKSAKEFTVTHWARVWNEED